jgi:uncharacterized protein with NRDE domain
MCTIAILFRVADAPLILAANRDEIYARPTRPPEQLGPGMVGGRDVLSGGTWLALRSDGRFVAVTNQRALATPPPGLRSRGLAVKELAEAADPDAYVAAIDPTRYASMNLVWGDADRVSIAYARTAGTLEIERLAPGVHVLCNDRLGAPGFPRGERLARAIRDELATTGRDSDAVAERDAIAAAVCAPLANEVLASVASTRAIGDIARDEARLFRVLAIALSDHTRVPLADVPDSHLPRELARELTATCIHSEHYGTRSASLITIEHGRVAQYLHAEGSPCTHAFEDKRGLL